jgi:hypothetical protein
MATTIANRFVESLQIVFAGQAHGGILVYYQDGEHEVDGSDEALLDRFQKVLFQSFETDIEEYPPIN